MAGKEQGQGASCSAVSFSASPALSSLLVSSHGPSSTGDLLVGTSLSFAPGRYPRYPVGYVGVQERQDLVYEQSEAAFCARAQRLA